MQYQVLLVNSSISKKLACEQKQFHYLDSQICLCKECVHNNEYLWKDQNRKDVSVFSHLFQEKGIFQKISHITSVRFGETKVSVGLTL